jgi:dTDP-glucose 4,6-dehydratase
VEDNCLAILAALEHGADGRIYNVSAGEERANLEVVREVCRLVSQEAGIEPAPLLGRIRFVADRPGHDRRYAVNAQAARRELHWAPHVAFEAGLQATVRWYLDHRAWLERAAAGAYQQYYQAVYARGWKREG